jgi:CubicO group peptidase (beta-lactamase class C family)
MKHELITPEEVGLSSERLALIKPAMQAYVDRKIIAGLSTMVAHKGRIVHFEQVGYLDRETSKPMPEDAIFRIYSMTKPIICTALMTLFEQGRFRLSDPVAKFIPAFKSLKVLDSKAAGGPKEVEPVRPVTVRDLMLHTSGLTYDFLEDSPVGQMYREARLLNNGERTLAEMIHELARLPLAYQPGSKWHYSLGIDVAAYLIEVLSDQPLPHFLRERIFKPLGMADTDFCVPPEKQDRLATMYGRPDICDPSMTFSKFITAWENGFNEQIDVSVTYPTSRPDDFARGGHGLYSTTWDYIRFAQMLLNQGTLDGARILGRKVAELMHMNHLSPELLPYELAGEPTPGYGFGLGSRVLMNVAASQLPGSVGEFGWSGAANTYYWVDPIEKIIGVMMSQNMIGFGAPEQDFQILTYQALVD